MSTTHDAAGTAGWSSLSDQAWVALHVPRFKAVRPCYQVYEKFLEAVLKETCDRVAPMAIVSARAKTIASFAEKVLRKRKSYTRSRDPLPPDPLVRMTDLCGGRVITQTAGQVAAVCQFIEEAFDIDWPNSEDAGKRLQPTQFGYRSIHYIVLVNPAKLRAAGIMLPVPPELLEPTRLSAEVQVRTVLEHAYANAVHDQTYKTEVQIPDRIHRRFAGVAAALEGTDRELSRLVQELHEFESNFGAYHLSHEVEAEIARLRIILEHTPENVDLAVKSAHLALSIGKHEIALEILKPYRGADHQGVQRALGLTLCEMHEESPGSDGYVEGRTFLEKACAHPKRDAETMCALAESWRHDEEDRARDLFGQAAAIDPTEPLTLCRYLEFEIAHHNSGAIISLAAPLIRSAMDRCHKQIEGRVNLPAAWACLGTFHLLLGEPFAAIHALTHVVALCPQPGAGRPATLNAAARVLRRTRDSLSRLKPVRTRLPGFDWFQRCVLLGLAARVQERKAIDAARKLASWGDGVPHLTAEDRIVIFSGGCALVVQPAMDEWRAALLVACDGLSFTLVCGGTRMGMSGLAGDVAESSGGRIRAIGYLPRSLPRQVQQDGNPERYETLVPSPGDDFSPLQPLQAWTDMIAAGVDPEHVKVLGYAGGEIARVEYAMALALGARVGVIEDARLPRERQFDAAVWADHRNLVLLPLDRMTVRAFLLVDELPARKAEFDMAARHVHEDYVRSTLPKDPSLQPWNTLSDALKTSNYHQVAYAENILKTAGLGVRPLTDPARPLLDMDEAIGPDGVRRLAEMEHGRWNAERLLLGWRYAEAKDVARRLSPFLVPWDALPPDIQDYDLQAIRGLPRTFREAGLEVWVLS